MNLYIILEQMYSACFRWRRGAYSRLFIERRGDGHLDQG